MATRERFTDEQWEQARALPGLVLMAASLSDGKALPSLRELKAGSDVVLAGAARYPDNLLLQQLEEGAPAAQRGSSAGATDRPEGAEALREALLQDIELALALVRTRITTEEYVQLREVLEQAASAVVERIGPGFLGSGEKVSESEKVFVERLRSLLA